LEPKSNGSQLKDAVALPVFRLENLVTLLANGNLHKALYFLSIVLWQVVNQALNITREGRIRFLGIVFEVGRKCAETDEHCGLSHRCTLGETAFFYGIKDIQKLLCFPVVIGVILNLPLPRIAINRIGTIDLEHLFGATRHVTHGNNHSNKSMHCLVKTNIATQFRQKWRLVLRGKCHRSLGVFMTECCEMSSSKFARRIS
jgi:hypothetical protein